jgi:glycosyltransferase involved in cell wall biosynthesis
VSFAGLVSRHQLIKFYQNASVFVFPSVWNEPFGMPIIEAMAAGLPVVATVSGGITEIVKNGETGLLVERGDASALAEAILRFLSDEDLRNSMAKASRKRAVELFSWECVVDNLLHLYRNICEDNE